MTKQRDASIDALNTETTIGLIFFQILFAHLLKHVKGVEI